MKLAHLGQLPSAAMPGSAGADVEDAFHEFRIPECRNPNSGKPQRLKERKEDAKEREIFNSSSENNLFFLNSLRPLRALCVFAASSAFVIDTTFDF
jgi:hypothetical protein